MANYGQKAYPSILHPTQDDEDDEDGLTINLNASRTSFAQSEQRARILNMPRDETPDDGLPTKEIIAKAAAWNVSTIAGRRENSAGIHATEENIQAIPGVPTDPPGQYIQRQYIAHPSLVQRSMHQIVILGLILCLSIVTLAFAPAIAKSLHSQPGQVAPKQTPQPAITSHPVKKSTPTRTATRTATHHVAQTSSAPSSAPIPPVQASAIPTIAPKISPPIPTQASTTVPVATTFSCVNGTGYSSYCAWETQLSPVSAVSITVDANSGGTFDVAEETATGQALKSVQGSGSITFDIPSPPSSFMIVVTPMGSSSALYTLHVNRY